MVDVSMCIYDTQTKSRGVLAEQAFLNVLTYCAEAVRCTDVILSPSDSAIP